VKSLIPLNSGGLWEAVTIMPVSKPDSRVSNARAGVGKIPKSTTFMPQESKPAVTASLIISLLIRVSVAIQTVEVGGSVVPTAKAAQWQKSGDKSWLTMPRIPLVPNNLLVCISCLNLS
jgi:hypothetical protein